MLADNDSLKLFIGAGVDFAVTRELLTNSRSVVKGFVQALCEAIALAREDRSWADRIYGRYLNVKDPVLLDFMYRTYVEGAIPQRPFPKAENVSARNRRVRGETWTQEQERRLISWMRV